VLTRVLLFSILSSLFDRYRTVRYFAVSYILSCFRTISCHSIQKWCNRLYVSVAVFFSLTIEFISNFWLKYFIKHEFCLLENRVMRKSLLLGATTDSVVQHSVGKRFGSNWHTVCLLYRSGLVWVESCYFIATLLKPAFGESYRRLHEHVGSKGT
jgi:hypothetical protein